MLGYRCTPDQLPALCRPLWVRVIKSQVTPATSAATAANAGSIQLWGRRDFISKPCRGDPDADGRPSRTSQTGGAFVAGWTNCSPLSLRLIAAAACLALVLLKLDKLSTRMPNAFDPRASSPARASLTGLPVGVGSGTKFCPSRYIPPHHLKASAVRDCGMPACLHKRVSMPICSGERSSGTVPFLPPAKMPERSVPKAYLRAQRMQHVTSRR